MSKLSVAEWLEFQRWREGSAEGLFRRRRWTRWDWFRVGVVFWLSMFLRMALSDRWDYSMGFCRRSVRYAGRQQRRFAGWRKR